MGKEQPINGEPEDKETSSQKETKTTSKGRGRSSQRKQPKTPSTVVRRSTRNTTITPMTNNKEEEKTVLTEESTPMETEAPASEDQSKTADADAPAQFNDPIDVLGDGGILKTILTPAAADARGPPPSGSKVKAHYTGTLVSDGSKFDSSVDRSEPFEFTIGRGQVIKGWDEGFASMKVGEKAKLTIRSDYGYGDNGSPPKIPGKADLNFEVELIDFTEDDDEDQLNDEKKQKWDMSDEEKKAAAEKLKEEGTELFKKQDYANAAEKYTEASEYINDDEESTVPGNSKELYINCLNNAAMCLLKIKRYSATVSACSSVIRVDEKNVKALYRRGLASMKTEDFPKAKNDLLLARSLDKKNKAVHKACSELKGAITAAKEKEKNMFANMFDKVSMYDDKKTAELNVVPNANGDNPYVFFDIAQGDKKLGRIVMQLYMDVTPKTAGNFKAICTGDNDDKLTYKNSIFHRVIKDFMIQGGDITNADGTGGKSIYGDKFADENFHIKHTKGGLLSMANSGVNTNGSQFFITSKETPHLNGKHVVFGEVVEGMDVVRLVENVEKGESDKPKEDILIEDCGGIEWKKSVTEDPAPPSADENVVNEVTDDEDIEKDAEPANKKS